MLIAGIFYMVFGHVAFFAFSPSLSFYPAVWHSPHSHSPQLPTHGGGLESGDESLLVETSAVADVF